MKCKKIVAAAMLIGLLAQGSANAQMRITEWMYSGAGTAPISNEFIEFTNIGGSSIDMSTYSFDDDSRTAGVVSLSAFGTVAPGESVILTEGTEAGFRTAWGLPLTAKVIGGNAANLGRNDEINLYTGTTLVDRLTFGDQALSGSIRTQNTSGTPSTLAAVGANDVYQWQFSSLGDSFGSYASVAPAAGDVANPGVFSLYEAPTVPEPSSLVLLALGASLIGLRRRGK